MKNLVAALIAGVALTAISAAQAEDISPAVIFDMGGKFDKSFNEAAFHGAERFKEKTGIAYREFEVTNETQREQALRNMARRGSNVIAVAGFSQEQPVRTVAPEFPNVKFCIVDAVIADVPNVRSYTFKEHEGSFLVGMIAGLKSATGKVGFVGGMDIPLIRNFGYGYEQGLKYVKPDGEVFSNMTGTTPAAWNDPARGAELAKSQFDRGADIVYAAAGGTGLGVLQAAKDDGKLSIGVDSNQNYLHPGSVLTSMLKRVDVAIETCFGDAKDGKWTSGHNSLGLKEDGVGYALDEFNKPLLDAALLEKVEAAKAEIIAGKLEVKPYTP
jgi:basic membrane protein A and related proteins